MSKTHEADTAERRPDQDADERREKAEAAEAQRRTHEEQVREAQRRADLTTEARVREDQEAADKAADAKAKANAKLEAYLAPFGLGPVPLGPQVNPLHPFEDLPENTVCELIVGNILHGPTSLAALRAFAELVTAPPVEQPPASRSNPNKGV